MHHATPLITTIVGGLVLAFILGIDRKSVV